MEALFKNGQIESISLAEWVSHHPGEDDLRTLFLNLDMALKYIHEHGYCIQSFYPTEINVLNNRNDYIQFKKLIELSSDAVRRKEMIKEDIFNSALIQIGIYSSSLKFLTPNFLRDNFDSFVQFLPSGDVPYYRGVVQRGASVYLCEYDSEKRQRDLADLERQIGGTPNEEEITALKKNLSFTNNRVNDEIYYQINGLRESAFIHFLLIPTVALAIVFLISVMFWVYSLF